MAEAFKEALAAIAIEEALGAEQASEAALEIAKEIANYVTCYVTRNAISVRNPAASQQNTLLRNSNEPITPLSNIYSTLMLYRSIIKAF